MKLSDELRDLILLDHDPRDTLDKAADALDAKNARIADLVVRLRAALDQLDAQAERIAELEETLERAHIFREIASKELDTRKERIAELELIFKSMKSKLDKYVLTPMGELPNTRTGVIFDILDKLLGDFNKSGVNFEKTDGIG